MKTCDYRPLLLSNRLPEIQLNNPKSDTQDSAGPGLRSLLDRDQILGFNIKFKYG
jgi:hypothetical protein